uniref:Protein Vpu n=1 Tax=Human immunodeficiency virus type 1 TaxID=11676 RepID=A0A0A0UTF4_HV1|nr:vpu protein [Human immunodeficiency virus 1]
MIILVVGVGALIVGLIITIVVWTIVYLEYKKLVKQRNINGLIERIRERAEDSGYESEGDIRNCQHMVDMGHLGLLAVNEL